MNNNFKEQFTLFKTGEQQSSFYENNVSFINSPQVYVVEPTPSLMYPNTEFELLKDSKFIKNQSNRRDNTIVINNYHSNEVGQYSTPKNEAVTLFEPLKNDNALAGSKPFTESVNLDRWSQSLTTKNNEFPENTNIRPESIDGVPLTDLVRMKEKQQEELRGKGVNSIRLAPENRQNETAFKGEGISTNPLDINITKFKMKSYYDQTSDDYLKTTGQYIKPEWRSKVHEPSMDRTKAKQMIGPATSVVSNNEYRNDQIANPTQKEELIENTYISNMRSVADNTSYRNNNSVNPTQKEDLLQNTFILNTKSTNDNTSYRNNNTALPTIREEFADNTYMSGARASVNNTSYHNNMTALPTTREATSNNTYMSGTRAAVDNTAYHNNMTALPTIRESTSKNMYMSGTKASVDNTP